MAILLYHDDENKQDLVISPESGKEFTLKELYNHLNCTIIEIIYLTKNRLMVIDEEGKLKDHHLNSSANKIFHLETEYKPFQTDYIAGRAIIMLKSQLS